MTDIITPKTERGNRGPELVFLNGLTHIGGIQIVLQTAETEFYFDLGIGETEQAALFNANVPAGRQGSAATDYIRSAMAPLAEGFYRDAYVPGSVAELTAHLRRSGSFLASTPYFPESDRERAVFTSHLHGDHAGLLPLLNQHQRVLMSTTSTQILNSLQVSGVIDTCSATVIGRSHRQEMELGDVRLRFYDMDHDTPGAMGFIAETTDGTFAYTGDWRYHGLHPEYIDEFAAACRDAQVDLLITEASTAQPPGIPRWPWGAGIPEPLASGGSTAPAREADTCAELDTLVNHASGLVFVCFHPQQLERAASLIKSTARAGRALVLEPRTAALWVEAAKRGVLEFEASAIRCFDSARPPTGIQSVMNEEIRRERDTYICQLSVSTYPAMLDLQMGPKDTIIHSNGHPLGSQYPGWRTLKNWASQLGCELKVVDSHGHATPDAVQELVHRVCPKRVIPVHSDHVDQVPGEHIYLPQRWQRVAIRP